jgi:hypothetical protein
MSVCPVWGGLSATASSCPLRILGDPVNQYVFTELKASKNLKLKRK